MRKSLIFLSILSILALPLAACDDDPQENNNNTNINNTSTCDCGITIETINGRPVNEVDNLIQELDDQDPETPGFQIDVTARVADTGFDCVPPNGAEVTLFGGVANVKAALAARVATFTGYTIPSGAGSIDLQARVPDCLSESVHVVLSTGEIPECRIAAGLEAGQAYSCPEDDEAAGQLGLQRTVTVRCVDVAAGTPVRLLIDDNEQGVVNLGPTGAAEFGVTLPVTAICKDTLVISAEVNLGGEMITDSLNTGRACCEGQVPCSMRWEAGTDYYAGAPSGLHALNAGTDLDAGTPGHQSNFRITTRMDGAARVAIMGADDSGTFSPLCTQNSVSANTFNLACTVPEGTAWIKPVCYTLGDLAPFEDASQAHHVVTDTVLPPAMENFACAVTNAHEVDITCTWTIPSAGEAIFNTPSRYTANYNETDCLADAAGLFSAGWATLSDTPGYLSPLGAGNPGDDLQFIYTPFVPGPGYCLGIRAEDGAGNVSATTVTAWSGEVVPSIQTIAGFEEYSSAGISIASADMNCDGRKDLIMGASYGSACWYDPSSYCTGDGKVYVFFALPSGGFSTIPDLTILLDPAEPDLGGGTYSYFGDSVAGVGNFTGHINTANDSVMCEDLMIGAPWMFYEDAENVLDVWPGRVFVLKGRPGWTTNIVSTAPDDPNGVDLFINFHSTEGNYAGLLNYYEEFGATVKAIGDFDGDGMGDAAIAASGAMPGGAVFIFRGQPVPFKDGTNSPVVWNTATDSFARIVGTANIGAANTDDAQYEWIGRSISSLGDMDQDGFDDLIVGAPGCGGWWAYGSQPGKAYIIRGGSSPAVFDMSVYAGDRVYTISQSASVPGTSCLGWSVAGLGDFNSDGSMDFAVSDIYYNIPATTIRSEGAVFVFFGNSTLESQTTNESGLRIRSEWPLTTENDFFGFSIGDSVLTANTPGGDFNNDGIPDLLVGTQKFGEYHGSAFIWLGRASLSPSTEWLTYEAATFWFTPPSVNGMWGYSVAWLGDINADGYSDIGVGDPFWDGLYVSSPTNTSSGRVSVIY